MPLSSLSTSVEQQRIPSLPLFLFSERATERAQEGKREKRTRRPTSCPPSFSLALSLKRRGGKEGVSFFRYRGKEQERGQGWWTMAYMASLPSLSLESAGKETSVCLLSLSRKRDKHASPPSPHNPCSLTLQRERERERERAMRVDNGVRGLLALSLSL